MLVLASKSPRRRELLANAGIDFRIQAVDVPEVRERNENPIEYVHRLARAKARATHLNNGDVILGADTVVILEEHVLEKPVDPADAARMLRLLSGRTHLVITGICLLSANGEVIDCESTRVRFSELSCEEIDEYVASGEPMDKAGAYAIQGLASKFIVGIEGCYSNVVGLPLALVYQHLKTLGQPR